MSLDSEGCEVLERELGAWQGEFTTLHQAAQYLSHLDIDQMRRVDVLRRIQNAGGNPLGALGLQNELDGCGSIENDQRASRSARSAWVGDTLPP